MVWTAAALSATEIARMALDKPALVAANAMESPTAAAQWRASAGGWADADRSHADYPARRAYDRFAHLYTKPSTAAGASATWYLIMDLAMTVDIDTLIILGHNFGDIPAGGVSVQLEISDAADFSAAISTFTQVISTNSRFVRFNLFHTGAAALRYSSVRYARLYLTSVSAAAFVPQIGELILGRRRQLFWRPNTPWDDKPLASTYSDFVSKSGVRSRYARAAGFRNLVASLTPDDATEIASIRSWFAETGYGTKPFLWCEQPLSAPNNAQWMWLTSQLDMPFQGPSMREIDIAMEEAPPFRSTETGAT